MRKFFPFFAALLLTGCASYINKEAAKNLNTYKVKAQELIVASKNKRTSAKKMEALGRELIGLATPIIKNFQGRHPNCAPFLDYILQNAEHMTTLSLERIEVDYHEGEALPKSPDKCYEAKELIVHPATVVVLAKKKYDSEGRVQMADEIEEVLAHIEDLQ